MRSPRWQTLTMIVALLALAVSMTAVGVAWSNQSNRISDIHRTVRHDRQESDHRWCRLLATIDHPPSPGAEPPRLQRFYRELGQLRHDFGCEANQGG